MAWLNLFLLMLEFLTLSVCQYEFLSYNERMIYLKKGWYFLLFFVDYAALFAATTLTGADGRTPAAVGNYFNIYVAANVNVPRDCCLTVAVKNTSGQAINFANSNLIVERIA